MAIPNEYTLGAVTIESEDFHSVSNVVESPDVQLIRLRSSGRIDHSHTVTGQISPTISFDTNEVGNMLGRIGVNGSAISATVVLHYTRVEPAGRSSGSNHLKTTINEGLVVPRLLTWNGGTEAWTLGVEIMAVSDTGATDPFVHATGQALPTLAAVSQTFVGGKTMYDIGGGSTELECVQSISFDFGLRTAFTHHKGLAWPVGAYVRDARRTMTVTNLDPTVRDTFKQFGIRLDGSVLGLRRTETGSGNQPTRDADADLVHCTLTMVGGVVHPGATNAGEDAATQEVIFEYDETAGAAAVAFAENARIDTI